VAADRDADRRRVGNLIDRIANGSVIDFIKLPHWPAFNVADMSITFGVILLALVIERASRSRRESERRCLKLNSTR
jgi:lipoprotein signal peptidase